MRWSWKVGTFADIGVYIHFTFLLLIGWVLFGQWAQGADLAATMDSVLFVGAIFGCVVLHEFGHALTARRYGIKTRDITLLPIGGVARLERMPREPIQEFWVALAGPAVNVAIAGVLTVVLLALDHWPDVAPAGSWGTSLLGRILFANIALVIFNMLPAFPMDGGRVLRAVLAMKLDYAKATRWAATVGQAMAVVFGVAGFVLFDNPMLVLIAIFVWFGAAQEAGQAEMHASLAGIPVRNAMITNFVSLDPADSLKHAAELLLTGSQEDFPVVRDGAVVGILTRSDLVRALSHGGQDWPVERAMRTDVPSVESADSVHGVLERFAGSEYQTFPVVHDRQLEGLLTLHNIRELLMIQSAMGEQGAPA